jgi:hypothetical protein
MSYSILKVHKFGPGMESSRRDEMHSYDDGNHSKGIQETLESVLRGVIKMIPSKL